MRLKSALRRGVAAAVIAGIVVSSGIPAYAKTWNIAEGDITVKGASDESGNYNKVKQGDNEFEKDEGETVITGKSKEHTVTIDTSEGNVDVTFDDLKIDVSGKKEGDGSGDGSTRESNAAVTVQGTGAPHPYAGREMLHYQTAEVGKVTDAEFEALLGRPIPEGTIKIDRNMTLGELRYGRSPLGWLIWLVLTALLNASYKRGKPDLNVLFQYNMPLRALAKMTSGAISMGMVDGIVMELQGFWIIGLVRVIIEAVKNLVLNAQLEQRLRNS